MRYLILIAICLLSCKHQKTHLDEEIEVQDDTAYYDLILQELNQIDIDKYYITYEIINDFNIDNDIKSAMEKTNLITQDEINKLSDEFIVEKFSTYISSEINEIINFSKKEEIKKIQINHEFSEPYLINEHKILILCSVKFLHPGSKELRGGTARAIILKEEDYNWVIDKRVNLIDY